MKNLVVLTLILCAILVSCNEKSQSATEDPQEESAEVGKLEGVWELVSYYNYDEAWMVSVLPSSS